MGTFSDEFWNVLEISGSQWPLTDPRRPTIPAETADAGSFLRAICARAALNFPTGAIVYLPPRLYVIGAAPGRRREFMAAFEGADLVTQQNVTLWFAPGARLVIRGEAVVRIDGPLRAEPTWLFACEGQDVRADPGRGIPAARRGRVVINSCTVTEVYPEWWGAIPSPDDTFNSLPTDDTDALEDCIRSAHTLRVGTAGTLPTIPIVLRGTYLLRRELEISGDGPKLANGLFDNSRALASNYSGVIFLGRQQGGSQAQSASRLKASTDFTPNGRAGDIETRLKTRALLRLDGLHASLIDGVTFSGGEAADPIASVCVQVTGNNARSTVFRGCSFVNARQILVQVGDYIILNTSTPITSRSGRTLFPLRADVYGGWDLSGLRFENCRFESDLVIQGVPNRGPGITQAQIDAATELRRRLSIRAREVTGLVFHAGNTLPMTLDSCLFVGGMAACVAAYGGTMIVRGGAAQNTALAEPRVFGPAGPMVQRPRGGVDFFIGDPISQLPQDAASPTGLTILQFESQSDQVLDTFDHLSASANRTPFYPTVLQGISHKVTSGYTLAPPSVVWLGPGMTVFGDTPVSSRASTLTLVACVFNGRRPDNMDVAASGAVVIDQSAFLVADVGTRLSYPAPTVFYTFRGGSVSPTPTDGIMRPAWLRSI
jgi:hypothetical protein